MLGVALFLLLAAALTGQSLWRVVLYLFVLWGICAAMALVAHNDSLLTAGAALKLAARALAMSIPLALLCFRFFPRIAGQFWALQRDAGATTGLSDEMSPGGIQRLATDYDPAFRVRFDGTLPPRAALYFRGPVLNSFDGFTLAARAGLDVPGHAVHAAGEAIHYRVTLEPTNPVLDVRAGHGGRQSAARRVIFLTITSSPPRTRSPAS